MFLVYNLEIPKNCKEVKHIMIDYCFNLHFFILPDIWSTVQNYSQKILSPPEKTHIVSSRIGTPFSEGTLPPFWVPLLSDANLKSYPPLSESHPNLCMQIVRNTLKWRCYILCYTKSTENIINITLFTFWVNSVFTTDTFFG